MFVLLITVTVSYSKGFDIEWVWANEQCRVRDMVIDEGGNYVIIGEFTGTTDFDPSNSVSSLTADSGTRDGFIQKFDRNGKLLWVKQFKSTSGCYFTSIKIDQIGNILLCGTFKGSIDFDPGVQDYLLTSGSTSKAFLLKLSNNGYFLG